MCPNFKCNTVLNKNLLSFDTIRDLIIKILTRNNTKLTKTMYCITIEEKLAQSAKIFAITLNV